MHNEHVLFVIQALSALLICGMATIVSVRGQISGDALVGLYGAALGYVFGYQSGSRKLTIEGPTITDRRGANDLHG